ncbi:unnamed protein product, partial [Trichogramma brassicae]
LREWVMKQTARGGVSAICRSPVSVRAWVRVWKRAAVRRGDRGEDNSHESLSPFYNERCLCTHCIADLAAEQSSSQNQACRGHMPSAQERHLTTIKQFTDQEFTLIISYVLPEITDYQPDSGDSEAWSRLRGLRLADPNFDRPGRVDVLLGTLVHARVMKGGLKKGNIQSQIAMNSHLGWILSGNAKQRRQPPASSLGRWATKIPAITWRNSTRAEKPSRTLLQSVKKKHCTDGKQSEGCRFSRPRQGETAPSKLSTIYQVEGSRKGYDDGWCLRISNGAAKSTLGEEFEKNHKALMADEAIDAEDEYFAKNQYEISYEDFLMNMGLYQDHLLKVKREISQLGAKSGTNQIEADMDANRAKLPQIIIGDFSGDIQDWVRFRDTFKEMVIDRPNLPNIFRMNYLRTYVKGEAAELLREIPSGGEHFANAWKVLFESLRQHQIINPQVCLKA